MKFMHMQRHMLIVLAPASRARHKLVVTKTMDMIVVAKKLLHWLQDLGGNQADHTKLQIADWS